jgi:hypothetical protein
MVERCKYGQPIFLEEQASKFVQKTHHCSFNFSLKQLFVILIIVEENCSPIESFFMIFTLKVIDQKSPLQDKKNYLFQ